MKDDSCEKSGKSFIGLTNRLLADSWLTTIKLKLKNTQS
jgi:hypothetical protein